MRTSLDKSQSPSQKVKNILIRHTCSNKVQASSSYQHPETSYILKYAPKYYKRLTLQTTCQSPLLSKVKKIKKLKKFAGYFDRHLPEKLWFNLLGNNRKGIEEFPQISSNKRSLRSSLFFWERLNKQKLKNFWNVTKVRLPKWRNANLVHEFDNFLSSKEKFITYLPSLRKLKSLKITVKDDNYENIRWLLGKLERMGRLLGRLKNLGLDVVTNSMNIKKFFQNKIFFSYLTCVNFYGEFDPIFAEIPQMCKKLNSLALNFHSGVDEKPEFRDLLTSMQELNQLKQIEFNWPQEGAGFWSQFKPQPSLEYLTMTFHVHHWMNDKPFAKDQAKNVVAHWEEIKALKVLEFNLSAENPEEFNLARMFIPRVLKKVQKVETLKFWIGASLAEDDWDKNTYEPFLVEDVTHLYESLKGFEYHFYSWTGDLFTKFDLKGLMPFKNLREFKLEGNIVNSNESLEEIVSLLEKGENPVLELNLKRSLDSPADWLRNTLDVLERTKKRPKVKIDLEFRLRGEMENLEGLCSAIHSVKAIKSLEICLNFSEESYHGGFIREEVRELFSRYPRMRNLKVVLSNRTETLQFIRVDGEKEQFFVDPVIPYTF